MRRPLLLVAFGLLLCWGVSAWADDSDPGAQVAAVASGQDPKPRQKIRVAITNFVGSDAAIRDVVTQTFTADLLRSKRLEVVERQRLTQVTDEIRLDNSGLVDPEKASQLGKLVGAEKVILGGVTRVGSTVSIDARLVDVETGRVEEGGTEQVFGQIRGEGEDVIALAHQLATRFHRAITGEWLPPRSSQPALDPLALLERSDRSIRLEVKLDRKEGSTYYWGDRMQISFRVDVPCYVYLFNVDTARQVTQLYPNQWQPAEKVQANRWYQVPGAGQEWELVIEGEMGLEEIVAVASTRPLELGNEPSVSLVSKSAAEFAGKTVIPKLRETPAAWAGKRIRFYTAKK